MFARTIERFRPHCSARNGVRTCFLALVIVGGQLVCAQDGWAISHRPRFPPARNSYLAIDKQRVVDQQTPALPDQPEVTTLEPGKSIVRELSGEQKHNYQITLAEGQYGSIIVEQRGIDVLVQLLAADGKSIADFNDEIKTEGEEKIGIVAKMAGAYNLLVKSRYPNLPAGRYEIRLTEVRGAAEKDRLVYEARALETVSKQMWGAGKLAEALPLAERAVELQERVWGTEHPAVAFPLLNVAVINFFQGNYAKAQELGQRALTIDEKALAPEHWRVAVLLYNLALFHREGGNVARAESLLQRALAIYEKVLGPNHPLVAAVLSDLGVLYGSKFDFARGALFLERAVMIQGKTLGEDHIYFVNGLASLSNLYRRMGDYVKAEPLLQRVVAIREKKGNQTLLATALSNLASFYTDTGDYDKAEPLYQRAIAIREKDVPGDPVAALFRSHLASLYTRRGDYAKAETLYLSALPTMEKGLGPDHHWVGDTLAGLADTYVAENDYAKAQPVYQRAISILEKAFGPDHLNLADILASLSKISVTEGKVAEAVAYQARANAVVEHNLALNLAVGSERQKQAYLARFPEQMSRAISLHVDFADEDRAARDLAATTVLEHKGRVQDVLSNSLASLRRRSGAEAQSLIDQLNEITSQLARLALNGPGNTAPDEYQKRIKALGEEREKLEGEISRRSQGFFETSQQVTLGAVQAAIPSDVALVEFAVFRNLDPKARDKRTAFGEPHYVVYVIRNQGEVRWAKLGAAKEIDARVDALRQALRDPQRKDVPKLARAVDEKVMQPVRALTGETTQLLISPDGELNLIPFAALVDEKGDYLVERYAFNYLTSGRDLLRLQVRRESKSPPVVVADPTFGEPAVVAARGNGNGRGGAGGHAEVDYSQVFFGPLPGVSAEVRALKLLLPQATFLTKEQATKAALNHVHAPSILHIATHGFFLQNDEPSGKPVSNQPQDQTRLGKWVGRVENPLLRSGLALAGANQVRTGNDDGVLTAFEASGLDLWGTKLVVLSACDTGIGEVKNGEGVYGLRRAFVIAGTESLMMSLWPVSDLSTRTLMIDYYKSLVQNQSRSEALRRVQLQMLAGKTHRHPYYWASFIQTGEWANLQGQR